MTDTKPALEFLRDNGYGPAADALEKSQANERVYRNALQGLSYDSAHIGGLPLNNFPEYVRFVVKEAMED